MKRFIYPLVLLFLLFNNCGKRLDKIPNDFIGDFYDKSGIEYWSYGLHSSFLISDCQFWDYEKIKSNKNTLSLWLKNKDSTKRIDIVKTDSLNFDFIENDKTIHCSKKTDSIKRIAKNNPFSMDTGTVVIRGYIKNAEKYVKTDSKIQFIFSNEVISDTKSEYADIDSLGRFDINMNVLHAASFLVKYRNNLKQLFVSPGDQLFISTNADSYNVFDFMGPHSDVCYDIRKIEEARYAVEDPIQRNSSYAKNPSEFKNYRNSIKQKQDEILQNYLNNNSCSEAFRTWCTKAIQYNYYIELLRYSWNRFGPGSDKPMSYQEPYYSFIDSINMNDSLASICYEYFFFANGLYNKLNYRDSIFISSNKKKFLRNEKRKELTNEFPQYSADEINNELLKFSLNREIDIILSHTYSNTPLRVVLNN